MSCWCGLGFFRGLKYYEYNISERKKPYMYLHSTMNGGTGVFIYANPLFLPSTLHKELYRLEVCIRKLEKNSTYYELL